MSNRNRADSSGVCADQLDERLNSNTTQFREDWAVIEKNIGTLPVSCKGV